MKKRQSSNNHHVDDKKTLLNVKQRGFRETLKVGMHQHFFYTFSEMKKKSYITTEVLLRAKAKVMKILCVWRRRSRMNKRERKRETL